MDRRKYKGVVLIAGLLFIICTIEIFLYGKATTEFRIEKQEAMGALQQSHPELEVEISRLFHGKDEEGESFSEKDQKVMQALGEELERKYGYEVQSSVADLLREKYGMEMLLIFLAGAVSILILVISQQKSRGKQEEEMKRLMQEKEELIQYSESVMQRLEKEETDTKTLITDISHQLKTPIASLKMGYEIAHTTQLSENEKEEFQEKGYQEVKKLETLLESLLNLSKLEVRLIQVKAEPESLRKVLGQAVNTVYMKAFAKQIEIVMEEFSDEILNLDLKWTAEAFVNILDNAIKYSPEQTQIIIRVEPMVSNVLVEICDEGIGVSTQEMHKIFQRFYRGENELIKGQEGSGVGLYLTRRILEEQGGTVSVRQGIYGGSIFNVTLPKMEISKVMKSEK